LSWIQSSLVDKEVKEKEKLLFCFFSPADFPKPTTGSSSLSHSIRAFPLFPPRVAIYWDSVKFGTLKKEINFFLNIEFSAFSFSSKTDERQQLTLTLFELFPFSHPGLSYIGTL
jgi:hypothetical protein